MFEILKHWNLDIVSNFGFGISSFQRLRWFTVGEHFKLLRRCVVKHAGALGRENVGMSNRTSGESPDRRKPKVSSAMSIIGGLGVPKDNCAFGHGRPMDSRLIFLPL